MLYPFVPPFGKGGLGDLQMKERHHAMKDNAKVKQCSPDKGGPSRQPPLACLRTEKEASPRKGDLPLNRSSEVYRTIRSYRPVGWENAGPKVRRNAGYRCAFPPQVYRF